MSTLEKQSPYAPTNTLENFKLVFEVYLVNNSISKRFGGITTNFNFVTFPDGSTDNTVLRSKEDLVVKVTWQPITEQMPTDLLDKETKLRKHHAIQRAVKATFIQYIENKIIIGYKPDFDKTCVKISIQGNYDKEIKYTISYKRSIFARLVQMPE